MDKTFLENVTETLNEMSVMFTVRPMTRKEWLALPESVRFFHPWKEARRPLMIKPRGRGLESTDERGRVLPVHYNNKERQEQND
jgi:hypothetical protein